MAKTEKQRMGIGGCLGSCSNLSITSQGAVPLKNGKGGEYYGKKFD